MDLIFFILTDFEQFCLNQNAEKSQAQLKYLKTVVGQFPQEAVNLLKSYYSSMKDVKHVMNLLLRGQKFILAGSVITKRALNVLPDKEKKKMLQVTLLYNKYAI